MAIMSHAAIGLTFNPASSSSSPSSPPPAYTTPPVFIAFTLGILVCFIVGFCLIYLCRCCLMNYLYAWAFNRPSVDNLLRQTHSPTAGAATPIRGIDPALLQIFPTFPYSSVKEFQGKNNNKRRCSLECAICLLEFEEDSFLRLLTVCCHVFHQECIDLWLESHKTCPVCRTDLNSSSKGKRRHQENQTRTDSLSSDNNPNNNNNETRIDVREEEEEAVAGNLREVGEGEGEGEERRFSRSHSTGHSIVVIKGGGGGGSNYNNDDEDEDEDEDGDKYTLKLPEHVQIKLIRGGYNYAKSCSSYTEMTRLYGKCCYAEAISTTGCTTTSTTATTTSCEPLRV